MPEQYTLPIHVVHLGEGGYHIFCEVHIEGHSVNALIDTGANKSVLTAQLAAKLEGIEEYELDDNHTSGIGKEAVETSFVVLDKMLLDQIEIEQQIMGLIDLKHVREMYHEMDIEPFEMIIGGDILVACNAVIDYGNATMAVERGNG